jgi:TPR repeat protein
MQKSTMQSSCRAVRRNTKQAPLQGRILSLLLFITALLIAASSDAAVHATKMPAHEQHNIEQSMLRNALIAFSSEDYVRAHARLLPLAQNGHTEAQFYLGSLYDAGNGVEANAALAAFWFRRAAKRGHVDAQYNMGVAYANGDGVSQDTINAVRWWRMAADNGSLNAQFNLGIMYLQGDGIRQDATEAVYWWQMAAEQGDPTAQYNLGVLYANGQGVEKNMQRALMWWQRAAAQDFDQARELLRDRFGLDGLATVR